MGGPIILRRLAALMRSCVIQSAPARDFDGGVSADHALRSYKWSYIRLAALHLRWQNHWGFRPTRWQILFPSAPFSPNIFRWLSYYGISLFPENFSFDTV